MRNERPAHTPGTQHRGNHDTGERLPQPLIHGAASPSRAEQHGIAQPSAAHRHRLEKLTVVILGWHDSIPVGVSGLELACPRPLQEGSGKVIGFYVDGETRIVGEARHGEWPDGDSS